MREWLSWLKLVVAAVLAGAGFWFGWAALWLALAAFVLSAWALVDSTLHCISHRPCWHDIVLMVLAVVLTLLFAAMLFGLLRMA